MATRDFKGFLLRKNLEKKQSTCNKIAGKQKGVALCNANLSVTRR